MPNPNSIFDPGPVNPRARMPVVFWIHGGGYVVSTQISTLHLNVPISYVSGMALGSDGGDLIREAGGGVVAVTIEYRLGVFGALHLSA